MLNLHSQLRAGSKRTTPKLNRIFLELKMESKIPWFLPLASPCTWSIKSPFHAASARNYCCGHGSLRRRYAKQERYWRGQIYSLDSVVTLQRRHISARDGQGFRSWHTRRMPRWAWPINWAAVVAPSCSVLSEKIHQNEWASLCAVRSSNLLPWILPRDV